MKAVVKAAILAAIAIAGSALAAFLYIEDTNTLEDLSRDAFVGSFGPVITSAMSAATSHVQVGLLMADALAALGTLPSNSQIQRIMRGSYSLTNSVLGGGAIIARVPNNPAGVASWEASASARLNKTINVFAVNPAADAEDPYLYLVQDTASPASESGVTSMLVGLDASSVLSFRSALMDAARVSARSPPSDVVPESVGVSALIALPSGLGGRQAVMMVFTTIFDSDPMSYLVATALEFDSFAAEVQFLSPHAVFSMSDHAGSQYVVGGCSLSDSVQVLSQNMTLIDSVTWTISVGQCPAYQSYFVSWRPTAMLVVTLVMTFLAVAVVAFFMLFQRKMYEETVQRARSEEKDKAHQLVVGYICHELRNPLHIVKTSFKSLAYVALKRMSASAVASGASHASMSLARKVSQRSTQAHWHSQHTGTPLNGAPVSKSTSDGKAASLTITNSPSNVIGSSDGLEEFCGDEEDDMSPTELKSVIIDAIAALDQMQSTVNEVLDFRAIESGMNSLKLNREPLTLHEAVMPVLMRCRAFLPVGVGLKVIIKDSKLLANVDKGRLGQIITNGMSNAGKFTAGGVVVVTVALVRRMPGQPNLADRRRSSETFTIRAFRTSTEGTQLTGRPQPGMLMAGASSRRYITSSLPRFTTVTPGSESSVAVQTYLCVTVSNPRAGPPLHKPEDCFIPFKKKGNAAGGAWKPVSAPEAHISEMREAWQTSMALARDATPTLLPELRTHRSGAVKVTTGLGLPLSRGFAHASAGWLALDDSQKDGMTHFWCVVEATLPPEGPDPLDVIMSEAAASHITHRKSTLSSSLSRRQSTAIESSNGVPIEGSASSSVTDPPANLLPFPKGGRRPSEAGTASSRVRGPSSRHVSVIEPFTSARRATISDGGAIPTSKVVPIDDTPDSLVDVISGECKGEAELVQAPDAQEVGAQAVKPFDGAQPTEGYSYPIDQPVPEASLRPVNIKHAHAAFRASRLRVSGVVPPGAAVNAPNTVDAPGVDSGRLPTRHIPSTLPALAATPAASEKSAFAKLNIAFVDDDPANQRVGLRFLKSLGVEATKIVTFDDGTGALTVLAGDYIPTGSSDPFIPNIIFLDIRMPGKSGIEVMQEIGRSPPFPIIAMTGNVDKDSVEEYRTLGFSGCIGKPFDKKSLKKAIEAALAGQWFSLITE